MFPEKLVYLKTHPRPPPKEAAQLSVIIFNLNLHSTIWISKPLSSGRDIFLYRNTPCQWLILKIESIECSDIFPYFLIQHNLIVPEYQDWLIDYWQLLSVWSSMEKKYTSTGWIKKCPFTEQVKSAFCCLRALLISCWALKKLTFSTESIFLT